MEKKIGEWKKIYYLSFISSAKESREHSKIPLLQPPLKSVDNCNDLFTS